MLRLISLLVITYPVVAHIALLVSNPAISVYYLAAVTSLMLLLPTGYLKVTNVFFALMIFALVFGLHQYEKASYLVYLPPTLIPLFLMIIFGRSLQDGEVPLVTGFAEKMERASLPEDRKVYTRNVTKLWVVVFALMVVESVTLAAYTPLKVWSWYTHIGNYLLIVCVILVEFLYRRVRFKDANKDFKTFINALVHHKW